MGIKHGLLRLLTKALERRGYSVTSAWEREKLDYQIAKLRTLHDPLGNRLRDVLEWLECDCVVDVGANRGQYHDLLRKEAGYAGLIVSYEPIPDLARALAERSRDDPRWLVEPVALGLEAGRQAFNVMEGDALSSFLSPSSGQPSFIGKLNKVRTHVEVAVRTLGEELERLRAERGVRRVFLKMDTQGWDLNVLGGAGERLSMVLGLQSEVSLVPCYDGMPDWLTALGRFRELGFQVSTVFPGSVDPETRRTVELDVVLVRPEARGGRPRPGGERAEAG